MGWDNAATVANEVENPQKTYPRVMFLALAAILISYVVPLAAVWHTHIPHDIWGDGSWASIASMIAGPWLGIILVATAMTAEFGSFNSLVMSYSRLPVAMAEDGHLPAGHIIRGAIVPSPATRRDVQRSHAVDEVVERI